MYYVILYSFRYNIIFRNELSFINIFRIVNGWNLNIEDNSTHIFRAPPVVDSKN